MAMQGSPPAPDALPRVGQHPTEFGPLLRHYRRAVGLSQEKLAERSGLSREAVSLLERGARQRPYAYTVRMLATALGLTPAEHAHLMAVARMARGENTDEATAAAGALPLVGRAQELRVLERHLAVEGPPLLLFAGEPGIGKSRLLRELAVRAAAMGLRVLEGGCYEREAQEPYAPLPAALLSLIRRQPPAALRAALQGCAWLVRLLPELADVPVPPLPPWHITPSQERRLMVEALARFLAQCAGPAGTLLILDDLQWAGPDTLAVLGRLVRTVDRPVHVLGAYRDTEIGRDTPLAHLLADLAPAGVVERRLLRPLAPTEAACLLDMLLDRQPPHLQEQNSGLFAGGRLESNTEVTPRPGESLETSAPVSAALRAQVLERAGGVPFFLLSYAQTLRLGDGIHEGKPASAESVPWDVRQSIRRRVAALPEEAGAVLAVAAVAGHAILPGLLAAVTGRPEEAILGALDAASEARLLEEARAEDVEAPPYRFAHEVIREAIAGEIGGGRRRLLHRHIAEAIESGTGGGAEGPRLPVEVLAYHYRRSDAVEKALPYLEQAGDRARFQAAWSTAADYYTAVLARLAQSGPAQVEARVREKLGLSLRHAARYAGAREALEQAAETYQALADWEGVCRALTELGHLHADTGTIEAGVERIMPVLERLDGPDAPSYVASVYAVLAKLYYFGTRFADQLVTAERAVALARCGTDAWAQAEAMWAYGFALETVGRIDEAVHVAEEAYRLAEVAGNLFARAQALHILAEAYALSRDAARTVLYINRAVSAADQLGDPWLLMYLEVARGMYMLASGDWPQARASLDRVLALGDEIGPLLPTGFAHAWRGDLALREGEWEAVGPHGQQAIMVAERLGHPYPLLIAHRLLAEYDIVRGHPAEAVARLDLLCQHAALPGSGMLALVLSTLAWAYLEMGDIARAGEVARAAGAAMDDYLTEAHDVCWVLWVQAMVALRQDRLEEADEILARGFAIVLTLNVPHGEAQYMGLQGMVLARQGRHEQARERYETALAIFRRLGARPDAARIEQALAALGEHGTGGGESTP